jgi:glycine/D-amino acid oxidase-like deaminating enzyme/nitrite reductase/ring-hydroxylating ferredoxin subunit
LIDRKNDAGRSGGVTLPLWMEGEIHTKSGALPAKSHTDVCIVGAGITGLTTAYLLARLGRAVTVLDQGSIGGGDTARTSAHLASALDDGFVHLEQLHGQEGARLAAQSHAGAIDLIEHIQMREGIDCDFRRVDGYLHLGPQHDAAFLRAEAVAAERAGLSIEWLDLSPGPALGAGPCIRFPEQAQFHPRRYLAGLTRAIEDLGGRIHTNAHVERFEGGQPARVVTSNGREVVASALVIATNVPVNDRVVIHAKQAAYRSYVLALEIPRGSISMALHWDTDEPYHYVRVVRPSEPSEHDILLVGGADHRTGEDLHAQGRWDHLEAWARGRIEVAGDVVDQWSGQILEPNDGLAFIGRNPADADNVFIATGDSGHGLTHGTIAATMFASMISGKSHVYEALYDPRRMSLRSLPRFAKESWATAKHYADWMRPGDVKDENAIPPGEGATMLALGRRLAVYRDALGHCHRFSATCRHLGGVVHWNAAEKTWDCPCHGARYDREGRVVNGPAKDDLEPVPGPEVTPVLASPRVVERT